jgi:Na+(H+)/acetate symporter ActP
MGWPYWLGIIIVGSVITFNVALGGMKGITIVQAMQYWVKVFAISVPCFVVMSFLGSYNETLGKALEVPKGVPIIPGSVISMKGKAGAPNNALALSTAGESLVKFESDAVLTSISVNPKPKKEDMFDASGAILAVGSSLEVSSKSKDLVVPKDTLVRVIPFEVTSAEGKKSKASLKLEFDQPSKIRVTAPRSQNDGDAFAPNSPTNEKWAAPFGPLTSKNGYPILYTYSLIIALVCGTAGLPHILVRFYTNPDGKSAKRTTLWVMVMLGAFYVFTPMWGSLGRTVMPILYASNSTDMAIIKLPTMLGNETLGHILAGITSAGAFAAFMSTFSGLLVSMSGAFAHDIYGKIIKPESSSDQRKTAFKFAAVGIGGISMLLGLLVESFDIAMMVGWAFAIGAASYFPLLLLGSWWRGLTAKGAATGMLVGGMASLVAIVTTMLIDKKYVTLEVSPLVRSLMEQPAIWGVPLSIALMVGVSKMTAKQVPHDVDTMMLRLHAPEELGHSKDYIEH